MEKCPTVCNQDMGKCFDLESAISCHSLMSTIISNCNSHPNELLACNDARLAQYPSVLKKSQEVLKKSQESISTRISQYAESVIEKCLGSPNSNSTIEVPSPSCDIELGSLQKDCATTSSSYTYCKDER